MAVANVDTRLDVSEVSITGIVDHQHNESLRTLTAMGIVIYYKLYVWVQPFGLSTMESAVIYFNNLMTLYISNSQFLNNLLIYGNTYNSSIFNNNITISTLQLVDITSIYMTLQPTFLPTSIIYNYTNMKQDTESYEISNIMIVIISFVVLFCVVIIGSSIIIWYKYNNSNSNSNKYIIDNESALNQCNDIDLEFHDINTNIPRDHFKIFEEYYATNPDSIYHPRVIFEPTVSEPISLPIDKKNK
jgi:hypothetical protein